MKLDLLKLDLRPERERERVLLGNLELMIVYTLVSIMPVRHQYMPLIHAISCFLSLLCVHKPLIMHE